MGRMHPDQADLRPVESIDYNTGRSNIYADINISDRVGNEPHAVRAQAQQINGRDWIVRVTHGPHEERDETGSYYKNISSDVVHNMTPSKMKTHVRRAVKGAHNEMLKRRPRDA